jgi:hypothetical protein
VLLFCLNDVTEKYLTLKRFGGTGVDYHGVLDGSLNRIVLSIASMRKYSSLLTALTPSRASARRQEAYSVGMLWTAPDAEHVREAWQQAETELDELRKECHQNRLHLLMAVAPYREQMIDVPEIDRPQQRLRQYAARCNLEFLDLRPELFDTTASPEDAQSLFIDSSHFTREGNAIVSRMIADKLRALAWPRNDDQL